MDCNLLANRCYLNELGETKIFATVGPASGDEAVLRELVGAGADVFRLNLSHGTREEHRTGIRGSLDKRNGGDHG